MKEKFCKAISLRITLLPHIILLKSRVLSVHTLNTYPSLVGDFQKDGVSDMVAGRSGTKL